MDLRGQLSLLGLHLCLALALAVPAATAQDSAADPPVNQGVRITPPPGESGEAFLDTQPARQKAITPADIAALRYYLRSGQREKYRAEVARLRRIDPTWTPPPDLGRPGPLVDERPLWELFSAGKYGELRSRIAVLKQRHPGWEPSRALRRQLDLAQERRRLVAASDNEQWRTVIAVAEANPELLACESVDMTWRTAEAYAETGRKNAAHDLYADILRDCADTDARLSTLLKADRHFSGSRLDSLVALERRREHSRREQAAFRKVLSQLQLSRLARAASGRGGIPAGELKRYQKEAQAEKSTAKANLIGWYYFNRKQHETARAWFRRSLDWRANAEAARGLAESYRRTGADDKAEALAWDWRGKSKALRRVHSNVARERLTGELGGLTPERLARYRKVAVEEKDAGLAGALGWQAYNARAYAAAAAWFERALSWKPDSGAAEGLALAYFQMGEQKKFRAVVDEWGPKYAAVRELGESVGATGPLGKAASTGNYGRCVRLARELRGGDGYDAGAALQSGWCLLALERPTEARFRFREAADMAGKGNKVLRTDAATGEAMALLSLEQPERAMAAIERAEVPDDMRRELKARALARQAFLAYERERYRLTLDLIARRAAIAPPDRGLSMLHGWTHYQLGNYFDANDIFKRLDRSLSTEDTRHALDAVREAMHGNTII